MADKQIGDLPAATSVAVTDVFELDNGTASKKATADLIVAGGSSGSQSPSVLDAATAARTLAALGPIIFEPTAQRSIDVPGTGGTAWDLTKCARIKIYKDTRALFGIVLDVSTHGAGLWTTPAGLNQDMMLPGSADQLCGAWDIIIDGPSKTVRVITYPRGIMEPMIAAPTASPGDTLDLFAGGTFTGHTITGAGGAGSYQTAAPSAVGAAFLTASIADTRRLQDLGDGNGQRLLMESARTNLLLQSQSLYAAAVITAPWVAIGATTGLGGQAGSPQADATVTNLIFSASAADGIKQPFTMAVETSAAFSIWARCAAGAESCRLQALLKDGTTLTTIDLILSTTWQRIELIVGNIGIFGSVGTPEFRILNGTDAAARTIQVWGAQVEGAGAANLPVTPSSYIKTVGATVARAADALWYGPAAVPAAFHTRGISMSVQPDFSNLEMWGLGTWLLATFDDPSLNPASNVGTDSFAIAGARASFMAAGGAWRIVLGSSDAYASTNPAPTTARSTSEPFTFARRAVLTLDAEAYRGAFRIQGAASGNGRFPVGGGPWTWPTGSFGLGTNAVGSAVAVSGSFGRFITAA